ncbi:hypothetical protein D9Q98_008250 [Chlorella vulgaris]|uniref:Uncharacterized protein n=1 Tax=Chlorella vulgaris TaxID=3077 RepID=A0A9D4YSW5_CHLVU|nr:hypothetical protein D9Q98_008250 [Chlorella vulgaris]
MDGVEERVGEERVVGGEREEGDDEGEERVGEGREGAEREGEERVGEGREGGETEAVDEEGEERVWGGSAVVWVGATEEESAVGCVGGWVVAMEEVMAVKRAVVGWVEVGWGEVVLAAVGWEEEARAVGSVEVARRTTSTY